MLVKELLSSEPVRSVPPDAKVVEIARMMLNLDVGLVPVVEGERLVGVITDRDIVIRCIASEKPEETARAEDIMSLEVVCAFEDQSPEEAKALMEEHRISRLPVISREHKLLGVISAADLEGRSEVKKKPYKVTMYRQKTDSYGRPHKVPLKTVYVSGKESEEEAKMVAEKYVREEHKSPLTDAVDAVDAEKMPDKVDKD
jgi:CBS domain-containing protein